jgi:hypothetical protein
VAAADLVASQMYRQQVSQLGRDAIKAGSHSVVDLEITSLVQYGFKTFGFSLQTVRRLTGLEARVFMRRDGTIILRLPKTKLLNTLEGTARAALKMFVAEQSFDLDSPHADWSEVERRHRSNEAAGALWLASAADLLPTEPFP